MQELIQIDHQIFHWINSVATHYLLDQFFPIITDLHKTEAFKILFIPIILGLIIWKKGLEGFCIFLGGLLTLGLADLIGGKIIKPYFARPRPNMVLDDVIMRSPHFGGFSFTSNHTSNMFCAAVFFGFFFPRLRPWLLLFACLIAYSRVYCGVHFPSDVIVGGLWGAVVGMIGAKIVFNSYYRYIYKQRLISWQKS